MAKKPDNFEWVGFTPEQVALLDDLDFYGNNGWCRNSQADELMPIMMRKCAEADLPIDRIAEAMRSIGYRKEAIHQLKRWENKRLTGRLGS